MRRNGKTCSPTTVNISAGAKCLKRDQRRSSYGRALRVFAFGEDAALDRLLEPGGLVLLERVQVVEPAQEQQVGDLLDDFERVGDAAGPEGVPDAVDLAFGVRR